LLPRPTGASFFASMGRRERQHQKVEERAAEFLRGRLHPGETIVGASGGQVQPRALLGLEFMIGVLAMWSIHYYYLVLTNQRVLMVRLKRSSGRPAEVVWAEPHTGIVVDRFKRGRMWMLLYLRRVSDGRVIRFRAQRTAWGATDRVTEVARVLREARGGLPG
jgi:hypothetical protein